MVIGLVRQGLVRIIHRVSIKPLALVCALLTAPLAGADAQVNQVAADWLKLIDRGAFLASWTSAAPLLQWQVSAKHWVSVMKSARRPFGKFIARELVLANQYANLPNVPIGDYWLITYQTTFERAAARETVTFMKVGNYWLPVGYYVAI